MGGVRSIGRGHERDDVPFSFSLVFARDWPTGGETWDGTM